MIHLFAYIFHLGVTTYALFTMIKCWRLVIWPGITGNLNFGMCFLVNLWTFVLIPFEVRFTTQYFADWVILHL